jgi:hypothetical protein
LLREIPEWLAGVNGCAARPPARLCSVRDNSAPSIEPPESVYDVPVVDAQGQLRTLGEYRGDVLLIVNTASY